MCSQNSISVSASATSYAPAAPLSLAALHRESVTSSPTPAYSCSTQLWVCVGDILKKKMEIQNKSNFGIEMSDSGSQRQRLLLVGTIVCTWMVSNMGDVDI